MVSALHSSTILPSETRSMTSVMEGAHCDATYHDVVAVGCLIFDAVADVREASVLLGGTLYVALAARDLAWKQAVVDEVGGQHLLQRV
jgi:hypothetical protein